MISFGPLGFLSPWLLVAGLTLPLIWWLLRVTPPSPSHIFFPATRLLLGIGEKEEDRAHSPWWLTLLRLLAAAAIILALSRPVLNPQSRTLAGKELLVALVDNGWAAAAQWSERRETMRQLLELAEQQNKRTLILSTADPDERKTRVPLLVQEAREQFAAITPFPHNPERLKTLADLEKRQLDGATTAFYWLSDGLDYGHSAEFAKKLSALAGGAAHLTVVKPARNTRSPLVLFGEIDGKGDLRARVKSPGKIDFEGQITALDAQGRPILEQKFKLLAHQKEVNIGFDLPLELRNQVTRLEIAGQRSAGSVFLVDGRAHWQRVGLISGEAVEEAQPLLSPVYYVKKALNPFTEITAADNRDTATATASMLSRDISTLVLAGIGRLDRATLSQLEDWLTRGGVLVRFAGPRLEQGSDLLLPTPLRRGGRTLGGALSWSKPQKLAPFEQASPFYGLVRPKDVSVKRQVLADPSSMNDKTLVWARLEDGTPLVTARRTGRGLLVLFHVTANSTWSNLPHSGLFVDMLRRIVDLSNGVITEKNGTGSEQTTSGQNIKTENSPELPSLPPLQTLDGYGDLRPPSPLVEPIKLASLETYQPSAANPPGLYGRKGKSRAVNIGLKNTVLTPLDLSAPDMKQETYSLSGSTLLTPFFLTLALILFLIDGLLMTWLRRHYSIAPKPPKQEIAQSAAILMLIAGALMAGGIASLYSSPALAAPKAGSQQAADDAFDLKMSLDTRIAYVLTGDAEIDRISRLGLATLSRTIAQRTALEPADPIGVNIARDELAFFPLLYWPVSSTAQKMDAQTLARINTYMKQGGVILFDTQDQVSEFTENMLSTGQSPLNRLLGSLDIPPLEQVPHDHVLTRSFYLLDSFPGRWGGGALWVEALGKGRADGSGTARSADGVSSILITSNNMAAAWAADDNGRTLYPVVPGGERQREMAYRTGINIVMYALTGNYKADQVHLPALMRRLGQ